MAALAGRVAGVLLRECRRHRERGHKREEATAEIGHQLCSL
jgi:hypothetical protein